ncbi:mitochondrial ribosomal protein subunit-domain-containing protein [Abortiporus biennis]|nr:mitochondrial ribosomal protein subunit-domain-containing protein [Abortiporus biennis]
MSSPAASPFVTLLRQSKFASFDPAIGQVYSSHGGHLSRGNWGFKRPLRLRRRNAAITVNSVDSREQQTRWHMAEGQSRWIRMWEEVGITPTLADNSNWDRTLGPGGEVKWTVDTEFAPTNSETPVSRNPLQKYKDADAELLERAEELGVGENDSMVPNVDAMSDKEFEIYLSRIRELRPKFKEFVQVKAALDDRSKDLYPSLKQSIRTYQHSKQFISAQTSRTYNTPDSVAVEQCPHNFAGLSYTKTSPLQDFLLNKPSPARILRYINDAMRTGQFNISFGGSVASLEKKYSEGNKGIDWREFAESNGDMEVVERGTSRFRVISAKLATAPAVVGPRPSGLESSSLHVGLMSTRSQEAKAVGKPGSMEYVGYMEGIARPQGTMLHTRRKVDDSWGRKRVTGSQLLDTLRFIAPEATQNKKGSSP